MALGQPVFQENDTTDQHAIQLRQFVRDMYGSRAGVMAPGHGTVTQVGGGNMTVNVAAGGFLIPGTVVTQHGFYYCLNDAVANVSGIVSDPSNPRITSIIAKVRDSFYSGVNNDAIFEAVNGTPAASPVPPDLVALGHTNYLEIARITVAAGDTAITTGEISNIARIATPVGGTVVCTSSTLPTAPWEGLTAYTTDNNLVQFYNGTAWQPVIGAAAKAVRATDQTIATGTITALSWASASPNAFTMWSAGNPTRMTAPWRGYYGFSACANWSSSNSGFFRRLTLYLNGSPEEGCSDQLANTADANVFRQNYSAQGILLNAAEFAEFRVTHDAGADRTIDFSLTNMRMVYLGPAA